MEAGAEKRLPNACLHRGGALLPPSLSYQPIEIAYSNRLLKVIVVFFSVPRKRDRVSTPPIWRRSVCIPRGEMPLRAFTFEKGPIPFEGKSVRAIGWLSRP